MTRACDYPVRPGGLMRCCTAFLASNEQEAVADAFTFCGNCGARMQLRAGSWEWFPEWWGGRTDAEKDALDEEGYQERDLCDEEPEADRGAGRDG